MPPSLPYILLGAALAAPIVFLAAYVYIADKLRRDVRNLALQCGVHPPLYVIHHPDYNDCVRCGQTWGRSEPAPPLCELGSLWRVEKRA